VYLCVLCGSQKGDHLGDTGEDGRIKLKWVFKKWDGAWTGLSWLRIETYGGLLWMRQWTSGFHKIRGICWLAEKLLASQEGLCCMELVRLVYLDSCDLNNKNSLSDHCHGRKIKEKVVSVIRFCALNVHISARLRQNSSHSSFLIRWNIPQWNNSFIYLRISKD
jgi:hypothetical protein